jgi:hypothetical protein
VLLSGPVIEDEAGLNKLCPLGLAAVARDALVLVDQLHDFPLAPFVAVLQ